MIVSLNRKFIYFSMCTDAVMNAVIVLAYIHLPVLFRSVYYTYLHLGSFVSNNDSAATHPIHLSFDVKHRSTFKMLPF